MRRIMIIGGPGSGKTWLGTRIAGKLGLPLVRVDDVVWDAAGQVRSAAVIDEAMVQAAAAESWVIEGGNTRTYAARVARADLLVCLTPPRWLRIVRVLRRRPSWSLLRWTWGYDRVFGSADRAAATAGPDKVVCLRSRRAVNAFLAGLGSRSDRNIQRQGHHVLE